MDRSIPRRDFLQGALVGAAVALTRPLSSAFAAEGTAVIAAQDRPGYYPPLLNGMRGSHPGSFEAAHALRDGVHENAGTETDEMYDLIVVGAGISGLAAAHFFRAQTASGSRMLILDNHDDFGGHAKRNEFSLAGRLQLLNGGTLAIESPRPYSAVASQLIKDIGIDVAALSRKTQHPKFYDEMGLTRGVFFDRETFGADKLVAAGTAGTAVALILFGLARDPTTAFIASIVAGLSWIAVLATLNVSAQMALPSWVRGRGLAVRLLAALEEFATASGISRLYLDSKDDLENAIAFYARHGFVRCARYPFPT